MLDTNLLILLVAGRTDVDIVTRHKNLTDYDVEDYDLLEQFVRNTSQLLVTPHILTETSNLLAQTGEPDRGRLLAALATLIRQPQAFGELTVASRAAAVRAEFVRFGLTDTALLVQHDVPYILLTADQRLFAACGSAGREAFYFPSFRDDQ